MKSTFHQNDVITFTFGNEVVRRNLLELSTKFLRTFTRVLHLDVEEWSEELLGQLSYAIKNQLGHPKPPTRGFGTQNGVFCLLLAGSLWHKG